MFLDGVCLSVCQSVSLSVCLSGHPLQNIIKEQNVTNNSGPGWSRKCKEHDQEQEQHQDQGQGLHHAHQ